MSLPVKLETTFRAVLLAGGIDFQILRGHEDQATAKTGAVRANVRAMGGPATTPKSGNRRYMVLVSVESNADRSQPEDADPVLAHSTNVRRVQQALDDLPGGLALALSGQRAAAGGDFTCFFVVPMGELSEPPKAEERFYRETWGYECVVAGSDST